MAQTGLSDMGQVPFISEPFVPNSARFEPANRRRLSAPALRTFASIADLWGLSEDQRRLIMGYPSRSTYHNWLKIAREGGDVTLDVDTLARLSAVFGIHQALGILFTDEGEGMAWLKGPHAAPVFGGQPPLALVTAGSLDGLMLVRRFLDAARGGIYLAPNAIDAGFKPTTDQDIQWR
jgi:hypothetical protein